MNIKDLKKHVRDIISEQVYSNGGLTPDYEAICNDFMQSVKRQGGIKSDTERPLSALKGTAYVFGDNYEFELDYEVYSQQYVKSRRGDNYNEPEYDVLGGEFDFGVTNGRVMDKDGDYVCDFDRIAERIDGGYRRIEDWFVFDESEVILESQNVPDDTKQIEEITKREKSKLRQKAINTIEGGDDNVKSFLIITAENPMAQPGTNKINRNANAEMVKYLKSGNFAWQPVRGKYGSTENTKIIFNISLSEAKRLGLVFEQESFIYGTKKNGVTNFDLYMITDDKKDYKFTERKQKHDKVGSDEKDYYTAIDNKHKFTIPYDYFKESCDKFNSLVNEAKSKSSKYRNEYERCVNECLSENRTGKHYYINRALIYGGLFE